MLVAINRQSLAQSLSRLLTSRLLSVVTVFAIALALTLTALPSNSWAAGASGNQALNRPAVLVAPEPDVEIAVYLRPETGKKRVGYGVNGDSVTVLEQVGDNQSTTWNHIRFANPPYAEGWVQEEFVSQSAAATPNQSQAVTAESNPYLGNRQSQTNQQSRLSQQSQQSQTNRSNSAQFYSQRNQN